MRNEKNWKPSFVVENNKKFQINTNQVNSNSIYIIEKKLPIYLENIKKHVYGDFLDCGCGKQPYFPIYKDKVNSITCIDWANSMHDNDHLDQIADLNEKLLLDSNMFDSILLSDVLEHIQKPSQLIKELLRILKPKGKLLIFVPFFYPLHEIPYDYYRYTEFYFRRLESEFDCSIKELAPLGGLIDIIFDILNKTLLKRRIWGVKFLIWLSQISFIEKYNMKSSCKFPTGYFVLVEKGK